MKNTILVGRENEIAELKALLNSNESELISIIGRRRVGKTFLVQRVYAQHLVFELTGSQNASTRQQLQQFAITLHLHTQSPPPIPIPKTWLDAFLALIQYLEKKVVSHKKVIFFDELPWLATHRSDFLNAFSFFWNTWAVKNNIIVVICGSAASWMIQKVIHHKGGLYNRVTKRIHLQPFTLYETELFLKSRDINFNHYQITELYLAMGGIPHYLKEIKNGESTAQNIDRICFNKNGLLHAEFKQLYASLFEHGENHTAIVRTLATKHSGMTRNEIALNSKLSNGGGLTKALDELTYSGFISEYKSFNKSKKEILYRLTDEYSLFYLKFIENLKQDGEGIWQTFEQTPQHRTWSGYAFESICLKHLAAIKKALGITGVFATTSSYYQKGKDGMDGCQIDMLIDRNDRVINVCEIKWATAEYIISKTYSADLRKKISLFKHYSETKKQVFLTFITTYGVLDNEHRRGLLDKEILLDDLFVKS